MLAYNSAGFQLVTMVSSRFGDADDAESNISSVSMLSNNEFPDIVTNSVVLTIHVAPAEIVPVNTQHVMSLVFSRTDRRQLHIMRKHARNSNAHVLQRRTHSDRQNDLSNR